MKPKIKKLNPRLHHSSHFKPAGRKTVKRAAVGRGCRRKNHLTAAGRELSNSGFRSLAFVLDFFGVAARQWRISDILSVKSYRAFSDKIVFFLSRMGIETATGPQTGFLSYPLPAIVTFVEDHSWLYGVVVSASNTSVVFYNGRSDKLEKVSRHTFIKRLAPGSWFCSVFLNQTNATPHEHCWQPPSDLEGDDLEHRA